MAISLWSYSALCALYRSTIWWHTECPMGLLYGTVGAPCASLRGPCMWLCHVHEAQVIYACHRSSPPPRNLAISAIIPLMLHGGQWRAAWTYICHKESFPLQTIVLWVRRVLLPTFLNTFLQKHLRKVLSVISLTPNICFLQGLQRKRTPSQSSRVDRTFWSRF